MALIPCPECGKEISDQAPACIHCGYPLPPKGPELLPPDEPNRFSVVLTAKWMGASDAVIISLAPKSVTTPIAMEVSESLQGIPSLTAAIVVLVGLFGAVFGFKILQVGHVRSSIAQSLSMGTASHAVGTSRAMEYGHIYGAYASLGLILNGLLTALFTPLLLRLMGIA